MPGHGARKERLQEKAIAALMTCATIPAAAKQAGVSEKTLDGWLKQPDFAAGYRQARREAVESAIGVMEKAATAASTTLLRNLKCGVASVEVQAAKAIFELILKGEAERRLDELEELLRDLQARHPAPSIPTNGHKEYAPY
jgi:hypothetical protein